jgi:hypothetical protein
MLAVGLNFSLGMIYASHLVLPSGIANPLMREKPDAPNAF